MNELRWILLAAGLLLIAAIYAWGLHARRRAAAPEHERMTRVEPARTVPVVPEPAETGPEEEDEAPFEDARSADAEEFDAEPVPRPAPGSGRREPRLEPQLDDSFDVEPPTIRLEPRLETKPEPRSEPQAGARLEPRFEPAGAPPPEPPRRPAASAGWPGRTWPTRTSGCTPIEPILSTEKDPRLPQAGLDLALEPDEHAADEDLPRGGWIDQPNGGQKCGFAGPTGAQQSDYLPSPHRHAGIVHGDHLGIAAAIHLGQPAGFDGQVLVHRRLIPSMPPLP